ncbi:TPA: 30S ribosomal protein S4 [Candidatus Marinimicrobia bacterium]|nr:MAG: 30S ribosomal protein S4 [Marinimicrobia bacterium 46_43]HAE88114.1 30S ribosomal protein S4 [Candidatus Neomarinimicrobiota bacterium]HBY18250.1 30S ribosomal protein S4 [Candidatus Neomarinimicrobiota bacterium]
MARYRGPRGKICRRLDYAAFESPKFSNPKKNYPPGEHGPTHRHRLSEYGIQMREKQRIKYTYGVLERQFRNYFKRADRQQGKTGDNLMKMLESRLDNVVYRLGFAPTRRAARQIVSHKHVLVNDSVVNIPSYQVKPGDVIRIREKSKRLDLILDAVKKSHGNLSWLKLDKAKLSGEILHIPEREEIPQDFNEQLVVELYSK